MQIIGHRWSRLKILSVSWWIFVASGIGMIAIALITLGVQTIRTAMANPVNNLHSE